MLKKDYINWAKNLGIKGYSKMSKLELEYECLKKEAEISALKLKEVQDELDNKEMETPSFNEYLLKEKGEIKLYTNELGKDAFESGFSFVALTSPQLTNNIPFTVNLKHIRDTKSYKEVFNINSVKFL